jgi:adenosylcobyric acid synthase
MGICGGYQMLGRVIHDPHASESDQPTTAGLGLLPLETTFATVKRTVRVQGRVLPSNSPLSVAEGAEIVAYEIHMGRTVADRSLRPLVQIDQRSGEPVSELDGASSADGMIFGTYLHGLLENDAVRHALIDAVLARKEASSGPIAPMPASLSRRRLALDRERELDRLAATVRAALDLQPLLAACGMG